MSSWRTTISCCHHNHRNIISSPSGLMAVVCRGKSRERASVEEKEGFGRTAGIWAGGATAKTFGRYVYMHRSQWWYADKFHRRPVRRAGKHHTTQCCVDRYGTARQCQLSCVRTSAWLLCRHTWWSCTQHAPRGVVCICFVVRMPSDCRDKNENDDGRRPRAHIHCDQQNITAGAVSGQLTA